MTKALIHYYESENQMRRRLKSGGKFRGGPLCGNGDAHAEVTQAIRKITCDLCKAEVDENLLYYLNPH